MAANKIFLVGYMGCGKSTIGRQLADRLGFSFVDLDEAIEKQEKERITEIFAKSGEAHFRNIERSVLQEICSRSFVVVACGGGAPCHFDNMEQMKSGGLVLYLKLTAEDLALRLSHNKSKRPLIRDLKPEELKKKIETQLAEREYFYQQAHDVIEGVTSAEIVYQLVQINGILPLR